MRNCATRARIAKRKTAAREIGYGRTRPGKFLNKCLKKYTVQYVNRRCPLAKPSVPKTAPLGIFEEGVSRTWCRIEK